MNTTEILLQLLVGGLLGMVGQGLRIVVGLKKLNDQANQLQLSVSDVFETNRMFTSLLIGFVAGALAMVSICTFKPDFFSANTRQNLMTLIAAGYSGTDFIEGFIRKALPKDNPPANKNNNP